jgi:hypothetical protein
MQANHGGQMNMQGVLARATHGANPGSLEQQQHHAFSSKPQLLQQALPTMQVGMQGMLLLPQFAQHGNMQQQQQHMGMTVGVPAGQQFPQGPHNTQPPWRLHAQGQQQQQHGGEHYQQQNVGGMHGRMQGR